MPSWPQNINRYQCLFDGLLLSHVEQTKNVYFDQNFFYQPSKKYQSFFQTRSIWLIFFRIFLSAQFQITATNERLSDARRKMFVRFIIQNFYLDILFSFSFSNQEKVRNRQSMLSGRVKLIKKRSFQKPIKSIKSGDRSKQPPEYDCSK